MQFYYIIEFMEESNGKFILKEYCQIEKTYETHTKGFGLHFLDKNKPSEVSEKRDGRKLS